MSSDTTPSENAIDWAKRIARPTQFTGEDIERATHVLRRKGHPSHEIVMMLGPTVAYAHAWEYDLVDLCVCVSDVVTLSEAGPADVPALLDSLETYEDGDQNPKVVDDE